MAGLVNRDASTLVRVIADLLGDSNLGDQLSLQHVAGLHRRATGQQRDDQRLVEQFLDADQGVASGQIGDEAGGDLDVVVLASEVVRGDLNAVGPGVAA